jgi:hypothetical protein
MIKTLFPSLARSSGTYTGDPVSVAGFNGGFFVAYLAGDIASTTSVTIKIQGYDKVGSQWFDLTGATFGAISAVTTKTMTVHPAVTATTIGINVAVSQCLPDVIRGHAIVASAGTFSSTFTLAAHLKQ